MIDLNVCVITFIAHFRYNFNESTVAEVNNKIIVNIGQMRYILLAITLLH